MPRATAEQVNNACIIIDGEEWRDIDGYKGIYQVSSVGRVKHLPTTMVEISSNGDVIQTRATREYILKQKAIKQDYIHVGLATGSSVNSIGVHRLIASAFVSRLPAQTEVHHIDRNRQNNSIDNLIWLTPEEHANMHRDKPRVRGVG